MNSLKFQLFLAGIILSVIPMLSYQYITFAQNSKTLQATYSKELKQKTDLTTLLINKSIFHTISDIKMITSNIAEWINIRNYQQVEKQFNNFENVRFDIDSTTLIDETFNIIFSTSTNVAKTKSLSQISIKMIKEYTLTNMKDIFIQVSLEDDEPKIFMLNKIYADKSYFLLVEMNFQNISLLLSSFEDEILGQKPIFLLDKNNKLIFTTMESANTKVFFNKLDIYSDSSKIYKFTDYEGDEVISAFDTVSKFGENKAIGWKVITSISIDTINDKVNQTLSYVINIGVLITLLIFLLLALLSRRISNSIKVVLNLAKKLEIGDYTARVYDKNNIKEFEELTQILNDMSTTIEKRNNELENKNNLLQDLAHYDVLTGIANRMLFQENLTSSMARAKRKNSLLALFFIDLDQFKYINDSYGHYIGDEILKESALRLKSILREGDSVARLGGDEFTIVLEDINDVSIIDKIATKVIDIISKPIKIREHIFTISCSIGVSMYPQDATNKSDLIKYADTAMYKSKALGRSIYQFYSSELTQMSLKRVKLEKDIYAAIENKEFSVYYQAQIDLKMKKISGFEALVRWNKPGVGMVLPIDFLPLAEEIGAIVQIDKFVMQSAMEHIVSLYAKGYNPGKIALNLSIKMLEKGNFIELINELLYQTKCRPEWIEIEITEGQIMSNHKHSIEKLKQISDLGIQIAVDDFGTGYSSLSYLKHLPINKLKIDKSFIEGLPQDRDDIQITKTIISLAKGLNLDVIAEGVETKEQKDCLAENGCSNIQGYLYSKPLPAQEMVNILNKDFFVE